MNKENIKNIEFINSKIVDMITLLSNEYTVSFDTLINLAVLRLIDDINVLRFVRSGNLDIIALSERVLF